MEAKIPRELLPEKILYSEKYLKKEEKCNYDNSRERSFSDNSSGSNDDPKKSKPSGCCGLVSLVLSLAICITGCYVMWATDLFTSLIHKNAVISKNSMRYEAWKSPPVNPLLKVYIFNYTNTEKFERYRSKLKVQEIGPYTYVEKLERIDVKFYENGTASYRDRKKYVFSPEHSVGNESDMLTCPSVPYFAFLRETRFLNFFFSAGLKNLLKGVGGKPFIHLTAEKYLWGYEDLLFTGARKLASLNYNAPIQDFGILSMKNGTQTDVVTIYTGEKDPTKTGIVVSYNGRTSLKHWNSQECNRIDGTDGTIYPPASVRSNSTLYLYTKDLCRKIPLEYSGEYINRQGIYVMRFRIPKTVFDSGNVEEKNLCYCSKESENRFTCLPSGVFNVRPCSFGAPMVTSLPHFLYGDPSLTSKIEGMNPKQSEHETFMEIDPKLGIPIIGKSRFQINILTTDGYGNQMVLPMLWLDYGVESLPEDLSVKIWCILSFIRVSEFILSYGFILSSIIFIILLGNQCRQFIRRRCCSKMKDFSGVTPLVHVHQEKR